MTQTKSEKPSESRYSRPPVCWGRATGRAHWPDARWPVPGTLARSLLFRHFL